jgi:hypothetical protein
MAGESLFDESHPRIDDELNSSELSSDHVKEVYARFGLAYFYAEVLHRGLCNLYCLSQVVPNGPVTRPRIEEHLRTAFETTLGQLLPRMESLLPLALLQKLTLAVERRNFIAHHFWYVRIHLMANLSGIDAMVAELSQDTELFRELDAAIEKISEPLHLRVGMTSEIFTAALNEIKSGSAGALGPLNGQRKPKKEETIVSVFDAPTASGNSVLIFQTEDGLLWQLCDAGLGWSPYDRVDASWTPARKFTGLLPAKVNARPNTSAPWAFEMPFGGKSVLRVRPGKKPGQVIYDLRLEASRSTGRN